ncbi:MAG: tetratricopeptide repeat protein [candidate division WOR-3 bacterium]
MNLAIFLISMILNEPCLVLFSISDGLNDFSVAVQNYEKGNFRTAQILLENYVNENPNDTLIPEAIFYLLKIYDQKNDFTKFFATANRGLESLRYDKKRKDIFNLLLQKLVNTNSFYLAFEYLKRYDYLHVDSALVDRIILNLGAQGSCLDELLQFYPENESLKILKALSLKDLREGNKIFKTIRGLKGKLYLIKNYLALEDTLSAFNEYTTVKVEEIPADMLYQWAKISIVFNPNDLPLIISRMAPYPELEEKTKILKIFVNKELPDDISIQSKEDIDVIQIFFRIRHIDPDRLVLPDSIDIYSILADTAKIEDNLAVLRNNLGKNFYLDSIYCTLLLEKQRYFEAYDVIEIYLEYPETKNYARMVRALKYFQEKNYKMALNDFRFISIKDQLTKFAYAECLEHTNYDPSMIYKELIDSCTDSLFRRKILSNYINYKFYNSDYPAIAKLDLKDLNNDLSLVRIYLLSLVHIGKREYAKQQYRKMLGQIDLDFCLAEIEHFIQNKDWNKAGSILDSLLNIPMYRKNEDLNYNACLIPFRSSNYTLAETRFADFKKKFKNSKYYYQSLFKLGTLKYLKQEFDSAAHYYGLASNDSLLRIEAIQNQLIACKKAEKWQDVVEVGKRLIDIGPDSIKADAYFEIGYAFLRRGMIDNAVQHLILATKLKSLVDYNYWLAEAYLAKGDFARALYQYENIVNNFKKDEMWYPTAFFKIGLSLEMLGESQEAKKIYTTLIKERGATDVWGGEAQKRLELLK